MSIPTYDQQVGAPKPPRLRQQVNVEAAQAGAIGQFAQQASDVVSGFAGRLADLAAQNEINQSVIKANDQWRGFWSELQKDPEYTTFQEKFDTFYRGLHDDLYGKLRLPRAQMALDTHMTEMKSEWGNRVRDYSDDRAIDHARVITRQSLNQAIKDLDVDWALGVIRDAQNSMLYTEEDIAKLTDTALNEIIHDKTMNYARMLGDEGMLWLMGDEAGKKFAVDLEDQQFSLDPETRNNMAAELGTERSNRKKAEDAATWQYRKTMLDYAQEQIESGQLTNVEQLYDDNHQEEFITRHGFMLDLDDEDKDRIRGVLTERAEAFEKDREAYSDDMLEAVSDAVKAGDAETARRYIDELIDEGYAYDAMGRVDPELRRYIEQYERLQTGEGLTEFDRDANDLRARLRARVLNEGDLERFLAKHPTKEGRLEHDKMWDELKQLQRDRESGESQKQQEEELRAEYDEYFYSRYDVSDITLDQLETLNRWRYDNYPQNKKDPGLPGIDTATWRTYGRLIEAKKKELNAPEIQRRKSVVDDGERKIIDWYAGKIKEESEFSPVEANRLRTERDNKVREYHDLLDEKGVEDPISLADFLLTEPRRDRIKKDLGLFSGKREQTDVEFFTQHGVPELIPQGQQATVAAQEYAAIRRGETQPPPVPPPSAKPPTPAGTMAQFEVFRKREDGSLDIASNGRELRVYDTSTGQWVPIKASQVLLYEATRK